MSVGTRIGTRSGSSISSRIGHARGGASPMATVSRDATSGKYRPQTVAQWNTTRSVAGVPAGAVTSIWNFQDASGGIVDLLGVNNLSEFGAVVYDQALAGWLTKFCGMADAAVGAEFASLAASLPDLATDDVLLIFYLAFPTTPGGARTYLGLGSSSYQMRVSAAPAVTCFAGGNSAVGTADPGVVVRPHILRHNRTDGTAFFCTDQEKLEPTFDAAVNGERLDLGGFDAPAPNMLANYGAMFTGAAARLTNAEVKALVTTLSFSPAWSP